jgi:hypothetical protein
MSGLRPPAGRAGFRAALTFPRGVEEEVMLETGAAVVASACWAAEGRSGISGLPRGDAVSESRSGEPRGLLLSESSAMAGYGGAGGGGGRG